MKLENAGLTDVGRKRSHNEDSYSIDDVLDLYMVADGMGGHASGDVASRIACESLMQFFQDTANDADMTWPYKMERGLSYEANRLAAGIKLANLHIYETSESNPAQHGMGTTVVAIRFSKQGMIVAHVGDSRVYMMRGGVLKPLTEDHSLLNDYIKMKSLTPEEIENFPHKNVIVRALGMKSTVQVDVNTIAPQPGDVFLLCSDGLCGMIDDNEIQDVMRRSLPGGLPESCKALIDAANAAGGSDNITAVMVRVIEA